jgi:hypothetical protein
MPTVCWSGSYYIATVILVKSFLYIARAKSGQESTLLVSLENPENPGLVWDDLCA